MTIYLAPKKQGGAVEKENERKRGERDMSKLKTHRGAAKRFRFTGTGRIKRNKAYSSHILTTKSTKRKRNLRKSGIEYKTNERAIKALMPYL